MQRMIYPKRNNGSVISSKIAAKAKHALGLSNNPPQNYARCSKDYWDEVVEHVGWDMQLERIEEAKSKYIDYM